MSNGGFAWTFLLFVALWLGVSALLSHLGGWASLAKRFPANGPIGGEPFWFVTGSLAGNVIPVRYASCLFVKVNSDGLGMSIFFPFRFKNPPFLIPWSSVRSVKERKVLFFRSVTFETKDHGLKLTLWGGAARCAKEFYERAEQR
jgi:hypothetical protein